LGDALDGLDALLSDWPQQPTRDSRPKSAGETRKRSWGARQLRYHVVALIFSPREPYSWIRSVCAYMLLCIAVLALGWALASVIG
jgi:hypothetical protein